MNELLRVDSRAIVRMASGAAFYGVLSWVTNVLLLPSASLISVRPAIVVPVFFGLQWGPKVGFFAGFVGNLLGDTAAVTALLYRILHHAHVIKAGPRSWRTLKAVSLRNRENRIR